jgi:NADH-quinone oxidoreductase subunit N
MNAIAHVAAGLAPRAADTTTAFPTPHIDYRALLPMLIVGGVAAIGVLVEAVAPRARRGIAQDRSG